ncbi:MAG: hypothetical protein IPH85_12425 [Ignavibacteria bacterium]|nr:hypothetical protein [Ignavibacteria bacterium]
MITSDTSLNRQLHQPYLCIGPSHAAFGALEKLGLDGKNMAEVRLRIPVLAQSEVKDALLNYTFIANDVAVDTSRIEHHGLTILVLVEGIEPFPKASGSGLAHPGDRDDNGRREYYGKDDVEAESP